MMLQRRASHRRRRITNDRRITTLIYFHADPAPFGGGASDSRFCLTFWVRDAK